MRLLPVLVLVWGAACSCDEPAVRFRDAAEAAVAPAEVGRVLDRSPLSWAAIACAVIALLLAVLGGFEVSIR